MQTQINWPKTDHNREKRSYFWAWFSAGFWAVFRTFLVGRGGSWYSGGLWGGGYCRGFYLGGGSLLEGSKNFSCRTLGNKNSARSFADRSFFLTPLGWWASAPSGYGWPHRNACFSPALRGPDRSFAPGYLRGRPRDKQVLEEGKRPPPPRQDSAAGLY